MKKSPPTRSIRFSRLIICESFVDDDKRGPVPAALMSLNTLVETWGRNYTVAAVIGLHHGRHAITHGLRFTYEPRHLRFFQAGYELVPVR
ncbi:hypothetical protein ABZW03_05200 [Kitasatospora sp. NPDC004799]|uniref:hypothetical protein n=1 Tax=Kitasatospora sp. NPDC004799 TaxID=3154460 RepID=UPI0033A0DF2C